MKRHEWRVTTRTPKPHASHLSIPCFRGVATLAHMTFDFLSQFVLFDVPNISIPPRSHVGDQLAKSPVRVHTPQLRNLLKHLGNSTWITHGLVFSLLGWCHIPDSTQDRQIRPRAHVDYFNGHERSWRQVENAHSTGDAIIDH